LDAVEPVVGLALDAVEPVVGSALGTLEDVNVVWCQTCFTPGDKDKEHFIPCHSCDAYGTCLACIRPRTNIIPRIYFCDDCENVDCSCHTCKDVAKSVTLRAEGLKFGIVLPANTIDYTTKSSVTALTKAKRAAKNVFSTPFANKFLPSEKYFNKLALNSPIVPTAIGFDGEKVKLYDVRRRDCYAAAGRSFEITQLAYTPFTCNCCGEMHINNTFEHDVTKERNKGLHRYHFATKVILFLF
jgi:hypothetical protein